MPVDRPELRAFEFDPIKRVLENRGAYIAAAFTIARAYLASTSKVTSVPALVGFDAWSKIVREPLIWLGEADPVSSMEAARAADPERAAAHELIRRWRKRIGVGVPVSAGAIIAIANETKGASEYRFPQFRALLLEHAGGKADQIDPARLGIWLRKQEGRVYGDLRIDIVRHKGRGNEYVLNEIKVDD